MAVSVLIVDDEPFMRVLLEQTLEELADSIILHQASNGEEGWTAALAHQPAIFILDVMMPLLNGLELCARLRGDTRFQGAVIVLLTARGGDFDTAEQQSAAMATHLLQKPFDPDDIVALVRRYCP